ncbi:MAG: hypothetical protein IMX01_05365 [Limnochordaceae bacterium]|nr:hypothetical protein [Limnochordaceae bacterium]
MRKGWARRGGWLALLVSILAVAGTSRKAALVWALPEDGEAAPSPAASKGDRAPAGEVTLQGVIRISLPDDLQPVPPAPSSLAGQSRSDSGSGPPARGAEGKAWNDASTKGTALPEWWSKLAKGSWQLGNGEVRGFIGTKGVAWGPGQFGHLLISDPPALNWILLSYERPSLSYEKGAALLGTTPSRLLFVQRLQWSQLLSAGRQFWSGTSVQLGWSDAAIYQRPDPFPAGYLLPFVPYSLWSGKSTETHGVEQWGVDVQLAEPRWGRVYGELLLPPPGRAPLGPASPYEGIRPTGMLVGWQKQWVRPAQGLLSLGVEYARTAVGAYEETVARDAYMGTEQNVGFWLGSDSEALVIRLANSQGTATGTTVTADSQRSPLVLAFDKQDLATAAESGQGQVSWAALVEADSASPSPDTADNTVSTYGEVRFTRQGEDAKGTTGGQGSLALTPTGTPETTVSVSVGQSIRWNDVKVDVEVGIETTQNQGHRSGQGGTALVASVRITIPLGA